MNLAQKNCAANDFAFTFLSDRYMAETEVQKTFFTRSLEDCLAECLDSKDCRSVSFNRTDGGFFYLLLFLENIFLAVIIF